ncbi:unnamed protein product [Paramecium octaurelia]|uniref:Uncharacterized protein n=1 Tax=Paramecium octaurelia TaxID=43137 RepID=A0A8S1UHC0_PAROT|nr:unnamed protein product [Paramecium octaurelia]
MAKKVLQLLSNLSVQIVKSKSSDEDIEKQQSLNWQQFCLTQQTRETPCILLSDQRQNLEQAILNYQALSKNHKERWNIMQQKLRKIKRIRSMVQIFARHLLNGYLIKSSNTRFNFEIFRSSLRQDCHTKRISQRDALIKLRLKTFHIINQFKINSLDVNNKGHRQNAKLN